MKAIVLESFGSSDGFKLKEVENPSPKNGEVKIRVKAAGFNPVDYKIRKGAYGGELPLILGADCSGVIDEIGPDVDLFSVGDEVCAMPFGNASNGSYAEFVCLPTAFVAKKPKNLSFEDAAAIPLAAMTAYRAVIASAAVKKGDRVFVAGAGGGVGCLVIQMIQLLGPESIFTVAGSEESAQFLHEQHGIPKKNILIYQGLSCEQMVSQLVQSNEGRLFDATFDLVGKEMKRLCLHLTRHSGHFVSIVPEQGVFDFSVWEGGVSLCFNRNMSLHFVFVGSESYTGPKESWKIYADHLKVIIDWLEKGILKPQQTRVVGGLSVETIVEAHKLLEEGRVKGKLLLKNLSQ